MVWSLVSIYFDTLHLIYNKNKLYKTLDYWSRQLFNFDFLEKGLGIVSLPHFLYDFSRKIFLTLYSINWPNFIVWSPLLLRYWKLCFAIICFPGCDIIIFKVSLIYFSSSRFSTWQKSQDKNWNILRTNRAFKTKNHIFHHFSRVIQLPQIFSDLRVHL